MCPPLATVMLVEWEGHALGVLGLRTRFIPRAGTPDEIRSRLGHNRARVAENGEEVGRAFLD